MCKRLIFLLAFLIFAISMAGVTYADGPKTGIVDTQRLNVREQPGTDYALIAQIVGGTEVSIDEVKQDWYHITFGNISGWVHGDFIICEEDEDLIPDEMKTGVVIANALNLREKPGIDSDVLGSFENGMEIRIYKIEETDGEDGPEEWFYAGYGEIKGWVFGNYISFDYDVIDKGSISVAAANIRTEPNTDSEILTMLEKGDGIDICAYSGEWLKIRMDDGSYGWVFSDLVNVRSSLITRLRTMLAASRGFSARGSDLGRQVASIAQKYLGTNYVWGGTSPSGFDCSGLAQYVYKQVGISLNRVASEQARQGTKVNRGSLVPGDLVFFNTSSGSSIDHVGIYIGDNKFIHAANGRQKVLIDPLSHSYYNSRFITARRIIE